MRFAQVDDAIRVLPLDLAQVLHESPHVVAEAVGQILAERADLVNERVAGLGFGFAVHAIHSRLPREDRA